ncbi:tyrosine-type recombinase/integrase [Simonsiella muelleri]|uniref:Tyr recombinase domain-containing protein n=1 Tax=Simonsiella muelleri ATCC 29453 TaxID=641147 RepID=V9HKZ5_9NEIS|nr:tyrosine-type recombinase/integrase [Simonsiella muelleri]AUX61446.1 integrase [Simonsiella muelleri ATCC 29453]EFG29948.1 hypothetical protein HMPREF9021_02209 [Simonsiella muelleri ATCC 29453]UBQ53500.1 tyrosine-type recombinase/integrase [Simonsiella muelleri]
MGSILKRKNPSGEVVYRAQIRINKIGYPKFSESKTFSRRVLAVAWLKRREAELEENPHLLFGEPKTVAAPTLKDASARYLAETVGSYGKTKASVIKLLGTWTLGSKRIDRLKRADFAEYAMARARGIPEFGLAPVRPSTINGDLQYLRSLLKHAHFVWSMGQVTWSELDLAMEGLRRSRVIAKADNRTRLPTADELQKLTNFFYKQWIDYSGVNKFPMHLVMWFAIYSCRRQNEIPRLLWSDFDEKYGEWLVRDVKHPRGSKGNHKIFIIKPHLLGVIQAFRQPEIVAQIKRRGGDLDYLLGNFPSRSISAAWRNACKVLGITDLRFHDLRHEGATRLAEDGLSVPKMQRVTLHDDWHVLQRYVNLAARPRENRLDFAEAMQIAKQSA